MMGKKERKQENVVLCGGYSRFNLVIVIEYDLGQIKKKMLVQRGK